jgi:pilus assembly protein TadC
MAEINQGDRSVSELAQELGSTAAELYERLDIARQIQEHPYRTLAVAAGVGYVLGGGLFTPLTGTLVRLGSRAMLLPVMQAAMQSMGVAEDESQQYF